MSCPIPRNLYNAVPRVCVYRNIYDKNNNLGNLTINGLKLAYKLPKTKYIWTYSKKLIGITFKMTDNISYILKNID